MRETTDTTFIKADVAGFVIDGNSKTTAYNGTYKDPKPNSLSLPHISTCPGATKTCMETCYVFGLQRYAPDLYAAFAQNERRLHQIFQRSVEGIEAYEKSYKELGDWIEANCQGGFRWHVSGDVMGGKHALWIVDVCKYSPSVSHWIYTRTLPLVSVLKEPRNLSVNISSDKDNYAEALQIAKKHSVRLTYLSQGEIPEDLPPDSVLFIDYPIRGRDLPNPTDHPWWKSLTKEQRRLVCVADFFGQSEQHRCGPCNRCMYPKKSNDSE